MQIRTQERTAKNARRLHAELVHDVFQNALGRGGRQRQHRCLRKTLFQSEQVAVRGPKVVPPLADAMRFVDCDQADLYRAFDRDHGHLPAGRHRWVADQRRDDPGGEQRERHYEEFHRWLRARYADHGKYDVYFE